MGYTHYFRRPPVLDPKKFADFAERVKSIVALAEKQGTHLAGPLGRERPIITPTTIELNGYGDDESHESFILHQDETQSPYQIENNLHFDFCKTARKPYDRVVTAILALYAYTFPEVILGSDGQSEEEWIHGRALCDDATGILPPHPFSNT